MLLKTNYMYPYIHTSIQLHTYMLKICTYFQYGFELKTWIHFHSFSLMLHAKIQFLNVKIWSPCLLVSPQNIRMSNSQTQSTKTIINIK